MKDKRNLFWLYVALAYLITWIPWIPLERYAAQYGYVLPILKLCLRCLRMDCRIVLVAAVIFDVITRRSGK